MKGKKTLNICRIAFFSVKGTQSHTSYTRYAQESSALEHLHTLFPQASLLPLLPSSLSAWQLLNHSISVTCIKYYLTSSTEENAFITYWVFPFNLSLSPLTAPPLFLVALSKNGANNLHKDLFRSRQQPTLCTLSRWETKETTHMTSSFYPGGRNTLSIRSQKQHGLSCKDVSMCHFRITEPI